MDAPLNLDRQTNARTERQGGDDFFAISDLIEQLTGFVRRQFPIFLFVVSCSIVLGLVYLATTPPSYTAHAMLLIDSSKMRFLEKQQATLTDVPIDTAQVETQVEILKSENIGLAVVKELKLTEDPEYVGSGGGLIGKIFGIFRSAASDAPSETQLTRQALGGLLGRRTVSRVGRTYVLDIGFTSLHPGHAAATANAIADAYIVDQLDSKYQATRRASSWLQDRIKELRQQASDADRAVLEYKERNKIISLSGNGASGGRLLGEQQIEDLNSQLGTARAAAEEARARLERINQVMKKDVPDATVADSLKNEVINRLRNNYLDTAAKESIWSSRYGPNHLAAVNLRTQMSELRRSMQDELGRIAEGYKSDFEIAKTRVDGLERSLRDLVSNSQAINRDRLGLRDLESTAQVYHTLYDNFLQRYMEAIQQQSFPITEARVISAATAPRQKSGPMTTYVLALAGFIGVVVSFGISLLRESVDQVFRTARQVENALQTNCLAVLPLLGAPPTLLQQTSENLMSRVAGSVRTGGKPAADRDSIVELALAATNPEADKADQSKVSQLIQSRLSKALPLKENAWSPGAAAAPRLVSSKRPFMRHVIDDPLSAFAEAFRTVKVAADISGSGRGTQVIGVTSTLPKEGKSTISSNLAELIAHAGKQVILLDCDLRNPSLTRALAPTARSGLLEVLKNEVDPKDAAYLDKDTGLTFLPAIVERQVFHTNEILASEAFKNLIDRLRKTYDYIVVDFPPLAPVVDVRTTTDFIDSYIYVVEWGKTPISLIQRQLLVASELHDRLLGVVLNKANVRVMGRYEAYYGRYYHRRHYGGQYPYSA